MSKHVFIFPGQGAQSIGMGHDLAKNFSVAKAVFEEVDDALSQKLSGLMWNGPEEDLTLTANTQPALMTVSVAVARVLEAEFDVKISEAAYIAGHSLGEYSALAAGGAMSLSQTARLLRIRGDAMQKAVPKGEGAMAALLGADMDQANQAVGAGSKTGVCAIANDNAPGQIVVSGAKAAVEAALAHAKENGVRKAMMLNVSAPFHCPLMQPAADTMAEALAEAEIKPPVTPLLANVTTEATSDPEAIRSQLIEQVTGRVRWRETMESLPGLGVNKAYELGAGKVLSVMMKRITKELTCHPVGSGDDMKEYWEA